MLVLFLSSADLHESPRITYQRDLMFRLIGGFVQNGHIPAYGLFDDAAHVRNVCAWNGVSCSGDFVYRIYWTRFGDPRLTLHYIDIRHFPPSLRHIQIQNLNYVGKLSDFSVRYLPRCVKFVDLTSGDFPGSLDLRILPENLTHLLLKCNRLSGAVDMTGLPEGFIALDARENSIHKVVVDNRSLPTSLENAQVGGHKSFKRRVVLWEVNGKKVDDRVYVEEFPRPGQRRRVT
mmetsp:Transcript_94/g.198  ORF Transcript_94/g.198 Transcript_94/m.198 type:complete len:233 (-) Transcript_94:52-750(-)